jgi:Fur family transcriptional regulator, ferric uptake regulator
MNDYKQKFIDFLKKKGLKFTPEREDILDAVFSIHAHFDVEELFQLLRKQGKDISRATIYRAIPLLIESNMIQEILHCMKNTKYEHVFGRRHHDHLICINCGKVIEFHNERIERMQQQVCQKYGFSQVEHHLGIKGYCKECQSKMKN